MPLYVVDKKYSILYKNVLKTANVAAKDVYLVERERIMPAEKETILILWF